MPTTLSGSKTAEETSDIAHVKFLNGSSKVQIALNKLENVAVANALQLEAARRRAVPIRFNYDAHAKFEVAQPIDCRLISVFTADTLPHTVTLTPDLLHL